MSYLSLTILLASCPFLVIASDSDVRNERYHDVFNDRRTLTYANLLDAAQVKDEILPEFRQNLFGLSNINSAINPFAVLFNAIPRPFIRNPDVSRLTNAWTSCKDTSGLSGICIPATACGKFGGRPSGACGLATVCCVNTLNRCGGQVTLNNTYWTSPSTVSSGTTCGLTVTLDNNLIEQKDKICQVRLDFITFTTAQPNAETVCSTDTFKVGGSTNNVPIVCGDNDGQHMYLTLPAPVSQLQLLFTFGSSTVTRSWNIKIAMLPCGASYLAPSDCLQYFTQGSGQVKSFNWKDVAATTTRHLANQDYRICFRSEILTSGAATRLCITPCSVTNAATGFSLSLATGQSQASVANCNNDYIILEDGFDPNVATGPTNIRDRLCGERLNVATLGTSATVCSTVKPFAIIFRTNGDEITTATVDSATTGNLGFCLSFTQRSV